MSDHKSTSNGLQPIESQEKISFLQKVVDLSPNLLFVIDVSHQSVIYINNRVKDLLGLEAEYVIEQGAEVFKTVLHPDDYQLRLDNFNKCIQLQQEEQCEVEVRLLTPGKKWQWFKIQDKIFDYDSQGNVQHIVGTAQNIHEQKLWEERQKEEHRRLLNAQEIGHIGSFERKLPGDLIYYSPELYHILGLEPGKEEITVEEFMSHVHPDDREPYMQAIKYTHATGEPLDIVTRAIRPDGSIRHIHRRAAIIKNQQGVPVKVYGTAQDITDSVKAETERKKLNNLMRATEIVAGTGSYEFEFQTNRMYFSDGLFRLFGYEPGDFEPSREWIDEHSHEEDGPLIQQILEEAAKYKKSYSYTRRIYRKDGELRLLESQGSILVDGLGNPVKLIGLVQDVTERKKAEEELRKSEERSLNLIKVLQNAPDSYLVLTPDLIIELASDPYLEVTNSSREEIVGKHLFDVFPDNPSIPDASGVKNLNASLQSVLSTKKPHRMAIQHYDVRRRDGGFEEKYWSPTNSPVLNAEGEVEYIIHRVLDITDVMKKQATVTGLVNETEMLKTSLEEIKLQADEIQKNRKLLQSIFDASPNSIVLYNILYDKEGKVEDFQFEMLNAYNFEQLGFPNDLVGKRLSNQFPNVKKTGVLEQLRRTAATGIPADFETKYEGDGLNHYFRFRATKVENRLVLTSEDITERKKSEETIHQMLNGSISAITILQSVRNEQGKIVDFIFKGANKTAERINKIPLEQLIGSRILEVFPGVQPIFDTYVEVVETGEPLRVQRRYIQGHIDHWFDVSAVKNGDGFIMTFHDISEQKKGEQELVELKEKLAQKATDKYRKIINSLDEGYCLLEMIYDENGDCIDYRYLETNPVFEEQSGMANVLGKTIKELVPDIEPFWLQKYSRVAKTGESVRFEDYSYSLERWFDVYAFRMASQQEHQVALIFKDITERKEAEERQTFLLKLNDALRPLADPFEIQYTAMQVLGSHLEVNRAYYAEAMEDEDTLHPWPGYLHEVEPVTAESKLTDLDADIRKILLQGRTLVLDDVIENLDLPKDVIEIVLEGQMQACIGVPLVKNGKLLAVVGVHQAVPRKWTHAEVSLVEEVCEHTWAAVERARAENALRLSQERLQKVLTIETVGVVFLDAQSNFLDANDAFLNMIGFTREEFETRNLKSEDITVPEWMPHTWKALKELQQNGLFSPYEKELIRPDGTRWWGLFAGKSLNERENVKFVVDITKAKKIEEDLINAKEQAEAASKAKEDFVSTMSHEIRTPLNAVIGLTNLLLENNPRKDQTENLSSLSFSAQNLLSLINDILDFSKLEAGKNEIEHNEFDLSNLILSLQQLYKPQARNNGTDLIVQIDENIPNCIVTDQLKLSQILHNLLSNAVKFTRDGNIDFIISMGKREEETLWLDFSIEDTGIGVPEEKLTYIFEKFSQAESSTVRQYGGTGLGLTITKLLLELLGSEIKVKSEVGEGSRFYFSLPVKEAECLQMEQQVDVPEMETEDLSHIRLLVVEDVEINRNILVQFFRKWWNLKPEEAVNGQEAVNMAQQESFDLILMDVRMPIMDGYEATNLIRNIIGYENVPILALTADKNQEVQQVQHATQFDDLITKPFDPAQLKKRILHHLEFKRPSIKNTFGTNREEKNSHQPTPTNNENKKDGEQIHYSVKKYQNLAGENVEVLKKLINTSLKAIKTYKMEFIPAAENKDLEAISNLIHKNTTTLHYLETKILGSLILEFRENLKNSEVPSGEISNILAEFDVVISGLEKFLSE